MEEAMKTEKHEVQNEVEAAQDLPGVRKAYPVWASAVALSVFAILAVSVAAISTV